MKIEGKVPKSIIKKAESINRKYESDVICNLSVEYDCAGESGKLYWAFSSNWTNICEECGTITAETAGEMVDRMSCDWVRD